MQFRGWETRGKWLLHFKQVKGQPDLVAMFNHLKMETNPCGSFKRYQGKRAPLCPCRPCFDLYVRTREAIGDKFVEIDFDKVEQFMKQDA